MATLMVNAQSLPTIGIHHDMIFETFWKSAQREKRVLPGIQIRDFADTSFGNVIAIRLIYTCNISVHVILISLKSGQAVNWSHAAPNTLRRAPL